MLFLSHALADDSLLMDFMSCEKLFFTEYVFEPYINPGILIH